MVDECALKYKESIIATKADRYRELDTAGIDTFITFLFRANFWRGAIAFPMDLKVQIKTSDNLETAAVLLPISDQDMLKDKRLSRKMRWRVRKHYRLHPRVTCMLFVSQLRDGKTRAMIIEEIWRELQIIRRRIANEYIKFLA